MNRRKSDGVRRRYSAVEVESCLRELADSGTSVAEYARRKGLAYGLIWRWARRDEEARAKFETRSRREASKGAWREVSLDALVRPTGWAAEVVRPDGVVIRMTGEGWLRWLERQERVES